MKRLTFIAVVMALLTACTGSKTVFEGKIVGYNGEFTEFFLIDPESGEYYEMPLEISEDGSFKQILELKRNEYDAPLFVDKFMFRTCVEQGKRYYAEFDVRDEGVETGFFFKGTGAAENEFTRDFWNGFGIDYGFIASVEGVGAFADFKAGIDAKVDELVARLDEIGNPGFVEFYKAKIETCRNKYSIYYPYLYLAHNGVIPADKDYEAYLASKPLDGMSDTEKGTFLNFVAGNVLVNGDATDLEKTLRIAEGLTEGDTWNQFFMTSIFLARMQYYGAGDIEDAYKYYRSVVTEEGYYTQVSDIYESGRLLAKGAMAPEIAIADLDGNESKVSDLKGKALYIDFWASWCKPCCEEIPHLEKLVQELGDDPDVRCISISIDEDLDSWKKRLEQENPSWPQYIATAEGQEAIAGKYQISSIPRFILLDRNGKIITVNAPRPSELDAASLKALLK